jgi:hypothetical protein
MKWEEGKSWMRPEETRAQIVGVLRIAMRNSATIVYAQVRWEASLVTSHKGQSCLEEASIKYP